MVYDSSSAIEAYNVRPKRLRVNPRDRDNSLSISIKDNVGLVFISICVSVLLGCPMSLNASEEPPLDVNWACNLIMDTAASGHHKENLSREIEAINPKQQTVKLVFKPAVSSWKFVQYSILDNDGLKITEARATPPCNFISIRRLVKTADGIRQSIFRTKFKSLVMSHKIHPWSYRKTSPSVNEAAVGAS